MTGVTLHSHVRYNPSARALNHCSAPLLYIGQMSLGIHHRNSVELSKHQLHTGSSGARSGDEAQHRQAPARGRAANHQPFLTESVYKVVLQNSIPAQIRQLVLYYHQYKE